MDLLKRSEYAGNLNKLLRKILLRTGSLTFSANVLTFKLPKS